MNFLNKYSGTRKFCWIEMLGGYSGDRLMGIHCKSQLIGTYYKCNDVLD